MKKLDGELMLDIIIKHIYINGSIPALIIKSTKINSGILRKTVIIYHSFAHAKENTIYIGYELAKQGFICLCIDLDRHGERMNVSEKFPYQYFYDCMIQTALEIDVVINYLTGNEAVTENDITVMGISLGGMAAFSAAVIENRIQNIITIASSANFTELARHNRKPSLARILSDNQYNIDEVISNTLQLSKEFDPYYNINKIENKNLLMINGGLDTEIPIRIVKDFQNKLENYNSIFRSKRDFIIMNGIGHQVQNIMIKKACEWLLQIFEKSNKANSDATID